MRNKPYKKKNIKNELIISPIEEKKQEIRMLGFLAGLISQFMLEVGGCEVDYKINGENINDIEKLCRFDISERIKLAIKEERYEDAAKLKKHLDKNNH